MHKSYYAPEFRTIFIKIYDYEGAVLARACVDVMKVMRRTEIESLVFIVVDFQEVYSASLRDSDAALHGQVLNQLVKFGVDNSVIQLVCVLDPANSHNESILKRLNRIKPFYKGIPEQPSAFFSWEEAMDHIDASNNYLVPYVVE